MGKIIIIVLSLFSLHMHAQIKPIENMLHDVYSDNANTYYKDTNNRLAALVGTWEYNSGTDYFKISFSLSKELANESYNVYADRLTVKFIYKKNGIVKYDNYGNLYLEGSNVNTKPSDITSASVLPSKIAFIYSEPSATNCYRRNVGRLEIEQIPGTPSKLAWKRTTNERYFQNGPCADGSQVDDAPFIIPADMVLIKIN